MRIGELAKQARVTTRTIRYYEELGLLGSDQDKPERLEGDFRTYSETDVLRLQKITSLKRIGLSLDQIGTVLDMLVNEQTNLQARQTVLQMLQTHLVETDEKIEALQHFRAELQENIARVQHLINEQIRNI
ncbi:MAG TPA: MerR family transcriptional regulator [Dictyobacter sp.]|jgi:DNA-binding transcriptional MerR regulator|nr:MerR family transcriptional regulator [Dictyobacter sp.]